MTPEDMAKFNNSYLCNAISFKFKTVIAIDPILMKSTLLWNEKKTTKIFKFFIPKKMKTQATKIREIIGRYIYKCFAQRGYDVDIYLDRSDDFWYVLSLYDNREMYSLRVQICNNLGVSCVQTDFISNNRKSCSLVWNKEIEKKHTNVHVMGVSKKELERAFKSESDFIKFNEELFDKVIGKILRNEI